MVQNKSFTVHSVEMMADDGSQSKKMAKEHCGVMGKGKENYE